MWLFRYFDKRAYAEDFCNGKMRIMPLTYYQCIEDENRLDSEDGLSTTGVWIDRHKINIDLLLENSNNKPQDLNEDARYEVNKNNAVSWQWHVLCFSTQLNIDIAKKFKSYFVVSIHVQDIYNLLTRYLHHDMIAQFRSQVVYYTEDKNNFIKDINGITDIGELMFLRDLCTKRLEFKDEYEYRFMMTTQRNNDSHNPDKNPIILNQDRPMKSAKIIDFT